MKKIFELKLFDWHNTHLQLQVARSRLKQSSEATHEPGFKRARLEAEVDRLQRERERDSKLEGFNAALRAAKRPSNTSNGWMHAGPYQMEAAVLTSGRFVG